MTPRIAIPYVCLVVAACTSSGRRAASSAVAEVTDPDPPCDTNPTDVEVSDYWLHFHVPEGLMPDPQLDGRGAKLQIHRVRPVYANGKCPEVVPQAAVLIHGRTVPGPPVFDLRHGPGRNAELSVQEDLARAGIDTFVPSLLGYGRSSRFEALSDPCNASLPACTTPFDPNNPIEEGCDRTHNAGINPTGQQALLINNPLEGATPCEHSSPYRFGGADVWVRDIRQVVDDARERAGVSQVVLIGYSFGATTVGRALWAPYDEDPDDEVPPNPNINGNQDLADKISKLVFIAPIFLQPNGIATPRDEPKPPLAGPFVNFPLLLVSRASILGTYNLRPPPAPSRADVCAGHVVPGSDTEFEAQVMELDDLGREWGGADPDHPDGLLRAPTFWPYGFNPEVALHIAKPTLLLQGTDDPITALGTQGNTQGCALRNALPSGNNVLVRIECASHALMFEGCDPGDDEHQNTRCRPSQGVTPYGGTNAAGGWAGPHRAVTTAVIDWIQNGTVTIPDHAPSVSGSFVVNRFGNATTDVPSGVPTNACP